MSDVDEIVFRAAAAVHRAIVADVRAGAPARLRWLKQAMGDCPEIDAAIDAAVRARAARKERTP